MTLSLFAEPQLWLLSFTSELNRADFTWYHNSKDNVQVRFSLKTALSHPSARLEA